MATNELKVRENRARRAAKRQGLKLEKSRQRDPLGISYGTYQLVDGEGRRELVDGDHSEGYGMTLEEIEVTLR